MHILAFSTMEKPSSMAPEALIGARLDLLRCIRPVGADDVVLGQYVTDPSDPKKKGYHEDETVKDGEWKIFYCSRNYSSCWFS